MSYRQSNINKQKTLQKALVGVAFFILLILTPLWGFLERGVQNIVAPFWRGGGALGERALSISTAFVSEKEALVKKNTELEEQLAILSTKLLDRNLLVEENLLLQEELNRDVYGDSSIAARVLSSPGISPYDTLVLDIGEKDGVAVGDEVFVTGSTAIGDIIEVFGRTSRARLNSSSGQEFAVLISGNITAIAKGRGGGNFIIELPRDAEVNIGDNVSTASSAGNILGFVEHIEVDPNDPFQKIFLKSPVNIFDISWVEVLRQN